MITEMIRILIAFCLISVVSISSASAPRPGTSAQDDTVKAFECGAPPVIDGSDGDGCWDEATWQSIDQVWIPWGGSLDADDFLGRYKVTWSSATDKLYFLVDITDDVLVKGYVFPAGGWPDYDVVEIFIDEDRSGGDHTHDNNAFAYHVTAGNSSRPYEVVDLQQGWNPVDFTDHIDVVIRRDGSRSLWEIALTVYDDSYDPKAASNAVVELSAGKISGLSLAYCDNDDPDENPKTRDNFIGSVAVPSSKYNDHWQNASDFGVLMLLPNQGGSAGVEGDVAVPLSFELLPAYPNPFNPGTTLAFRAPCQCRVTLEICDPLGRLVHRQARACGPGQGAFLWDGRDELGMPVPSGVYLYRLTAMTGRARYGATGKLLRLQ